MKTALPVRTCHKLSRDKSKYLWEFHIMDFWPDPGKYTLRLECVGKNSESSGHYIGVNSIRLRERRPRVKAFGYDKDWRQEQILYD